MAIRSEVNLIAILEGLSTGARTVNPSVLGQASAPASSSIALDNGDNTITVPSTAHGVIIIFPATSLAIKTIKGIGGDTGIIVHPSKWLVLSFATTGGPITDFIINASDDSDLVAGSYTELIWF